MGNFIYLVIAILTLVLVVKLLAWPMKVLLRLLINGILGYVLLLLVNVFGKSIGVYIPTNALSCLIAGIFGVPGVLFLIIFNKFF
ncbi:pro-sigmaK processing inhibitor BofA family protein [Hathewaya histolytica]|uniref:Sigma-K factor processing regulatory protein BOFA n=1 Tax=Hathewaya histolytica TaxID=1498 RepID=A0A4U9QV84_HATHI|nr:pro-sigmaK processing inhibitor BofA family protein [Hathewaya histolytica]VTQ81711.1 sigma-K factor processing regulatory protein BOFA [Hathewaya histolytica]